MCQTIPDKAEKDKHTRMWDSRVHAVAWTCSISLPGVVLAVQDLVQCTLLIIHGFTQNVAGRGLVFTVLGCIPICVSYTLIVATWQRCTQSVSGRLIIQSFLQVDRKSAKEGTLKTSHPLKCVNKRKHIWVCQYSFRSDNISVPSPLSTTFLLKK